MTISKSYTLSAVNHVDRRRFVTGCASLVCVQIPALAGLEAAVRLTQVAALPEPLPDDLVAANRVLAMEGVLDGFGHVSVRHNARPARYLLARSIAPALVTAADIQEYDLDSRVVNAPDRGSYLERFIHGEIYRARPDVQAIVHCHPPSLIPFASSNVPMRAMYHMAAFVADGVPVFDIRRAAGTTDLLVRDIPLARALAASLGSKAAALMRGHGAVVVASSLPSVVGRSIYLEINARAQMQALALGGTVTYVEPDEARLRMADPNEYGRAWDYWKRKLPR
jgi:HCOMODA/2-hydroxy-3-carboxy-muconic semialdehyde decarboxylase